MRPRRLLRFQILLFAVAILLCFGSRIFNLGAEVGMRVVVTGVGLDREGDRYKLSAQIFTPILGETKAQQKTVVTAEGKTVGQAISQLSLRTGRLATISHCKLIVLGESLREESVVDTIKYFVTDLEVGWGAIVVCTSGKAEDTVGGLTELEQQSEFNWQEFLNTNRAVDGIAANSIREIMLGMQDKSRSILLTVLDVEKSADGGGSGGSSGGEQAADSGGGGGSGGGKGQVSLKTGEKTVLVRDGKIVGEIGKAEMRGFSWFDPAVRQSQFEVECGDGIAGVRLKAKSVRLRLGEDGGKPVVNVRIRALFDLAEAPGSVFEKAPPSALESAIASAIGRDIASCLSLGRSLDTDILRLNDLFFRLRNKLYARYGDTLFETADVRVDIVARLDT